jgi:hypothetical protein
MTLLRIQTQCVSGTQRLFVSRVKRYERGLFWVTAAIAPERIVGYLQLNVTIWQQCGVAACMLNTGLLKMTLAETRIRYGCVLLAESCALREMPECR